MNLGNFDIVFCTYFENKKEFIYSNETYKEYVIFCVESGSFSYGYSPNEIKYTAKAKMLFYVAQIGQFTEKQYHRLIFV